MKNICPPCIDKTILNLLSLLIAGVGIIAILLTKFDAPQLRLTYFGENPYAIKRDIIDIENVLNWIFIGVTFLGLSLQAYVRIFGHKLKERVYKTPVYITFFIISSVLTVVFAFSLDAIGRCVAKKIWLPQVVQMHVEGFKMAGDIIKNKGFYNNELDKIEKYSDKRKEKIKARRYEQCDETLTLFEDLLEIKNIPKTREERYKNIREIFQQY